ERQFLVRRIEQDAEQVQDFLGSPCAARKDDDPVTEAHEGLEALLDVRHDDELAHDRIRRLRGNDSGFADAQVAPVDDALLGMAYGGALHRSLHRAGSAAGADVQAAKPDLVADLLGVIVLHAPYRMSAP